MSAIDSVIRTGGEIQHGGYGILRGMSGQQHIVMIRESHNLASQITHFPVESGKSIADHVILTPNQVEIQIEVTNTAGGRDAAGTIAEEFVKKMDSREPFELLTEHLRYTNMVITGFRPVHQAPYKGAFAASIRLEQVGIIGESRMVSASGGRPASILAQDGTNRTACNYTYSGTQQPGNNRALLDRCLDYLSSRSFINA